MKRLKSVVGDPATFYLHLVWKDGTTQTVDFSEMVKTSRHFKIFADHPEDFAKVKLCNWGDGIEWENGLDYFAGNLERLADQQEIERKKND